MRAAVTVGFGGPEMLEVRDDAPVPDPGLGEALVEVGACCCNNSDIWLREGAYGREGDPGARAGWLRGAQPVRFPLIQGSDTVGRVVAVSDRADEGLVGKRVLVEHTLHSEDSTEPYGIAGIIGSERDGGFAEYVCVPVDNLGVIASEFDDAQVAALGSASLVTAERMLERARLAAGETILVTGASGGVGTGAVQLARLREARVVALAGAGKEQALRELGADVVVASRSANLAEDVLAANGAQVDVVADDVGGSIFTDLLRVLRPLGRYVTVGAVAGAVVDLDLRTLYLKHLDLLGSTLGSREDFARLVRLINEGRLRPVLGGTYPLDRIHEAQEAFLRKDYVGNLVITPR